MRSGLCSCSWIQELGSYWGGKHEKQNKAREEGKKSQRQPWKWKKTRGEGERNQTAGHLKMHHLIKSSRQPCVVSIIAPFYRCLKKKRGTSGRLSSFSKDTQLWVQTIFLAPKPVTFFLYQICTKWKIYTSQAFNLGCHIWEGGRLWSGCGYKWTPGLFGHQMVDTWPLVLSPGLANRWSFQKQNLEGSPLLSCQEEEKESLFSGCRVLQGLVGIWKNQSFWKEMRQGSQVPRIISLSPGSLLPNDPREESVQWKTDSHSK